MKKITYTIILLFSFYFTNGQVGVDYIYSFLKMPVSARATALGGNVIAVVDSDVSIALDNPAAISNKMNRQLNTSINWHFGDTKSGTLSYGFFLKKLNLNFHSGVQFLNYGTITERDILGQKQGEFSPSDLSFFVGTSYPIYKNLTAGVNLKFISSNYEIYKSTGIATDLGFNYQKSDSAGVFSVVFKNMGRQITKYSEIQSSIPFEMVMGYSKRLSHVPFRFGILYNNLQKWNITYDDPNKKDNLLISTGSPQEEKWFETVGENFMRHMVFSGELLLGNQENIRLRVAYNHKRNKESKIGEFRSLGGFSYGIGIKVKRFRIEYGRSNYQTPGHGNHISIQSRI